MSTRELDQRNQGQAEDDDANAQQEEEDAHHHVDPPEPGGGRDGNAAANAHVYHEIGCKDHALGGKGAALVGARPHALVPDLYHKTCGQSAAESLYT